MAKTCVNISLRQVQNAGIQVSGLTPEELNATLSGLVDKKVLSENFTIKDIILNKSAILTAIAEARNESEQQRRKIKEVKESINKIGEAELRIGETYKKNDPLYNPNSLYIFTDNLQAYNALQEESKKIPLTGLIVPKGEVSVNVKSTSAVIRVDTNGDTHENVIGLVVKKNAQDAEGNWIGAKSSSIEESIFTENDLKAFHQINSDIIDRIANLLAEKKYTSVLMPRKIALDNAGLPKALAEDLAKMLEEKLGLTTQVILSDFGKESKHELYGVEIQGKGKSTKKTKKKASARAEEAMESLTKERPVHITPQTQRMSEKVLNRIFPDIALRRARVQLISQLFSKFLDIEVNLLQDELESAEEATEEDEKVLSILIGGSEIERRKATLNYKRYGSDVSVSDIILGKIKNLINTIGELQDAKGNIAQEDIKDFVDTIINNPSNIFGAEHAIENQTTDVSNRILQTRAKNIIEFCALVKNTPMLLEGLVSSASNILERTENIKLSLDKSQVISTESELEEMEDEETASTRDGLYLVQHKMLDPKTTLSFRVKRLLSQCYKVKQVVESTDGGVLPVYEYNEFGMRIPLNEGVVYYNLLKRFSEMNSSYDFLPMVEQLAQEYPWFGEIASMIRKDDDLRNEFYRCFRQVPQIFAVITSSGKIQFKNAELDHTAIIDMVTKNYEGCNVLSSSSLYNEEGIINTNNVARFRRLLSTKLTKEEKDEVKTSSKQEVIKKNHPLNFVNSVLAPNSSNITIENVKTVHNILSGTEGYGQITTLGNILNSLGIDIVDLDLNVLIPTIDWEDINTLEDLEKVWPQKIRNKVYNIIDSLIVITKDGTGLRENSNLINDFRNTYLRIATSLVGISEGYTQASFYFDGNQRFSYTHPDFISRLVGTVSNVSNEERIDKGTSFLEDQYLQYNFFHYSPLINTLKDDLDVRERFKRLEILAIETGSSTSTSIGDASNDDFLSGLVSAYFAGSTIVSKRDGETKAFGYYRNPLFSDTESLNLFRLPRYYKEGYREEIIDKLVTVAEAEIDRIIDYRRSNSEESVRIDRYNPSSKTDASKNNAGKFRFLTALEPRKEEILNYLTGLLKEDSTDKYSLAKRDYLKRILREMMRENCQAFLDSITSKQKLNICRLVRKVKKNAENQEVEENVATDSNDLSNFTVTDLEQKPEDEDPTLTKLNENEIIAEADSYLEEFYYNDYYTQSQLIMLLGGDLAYYKDVRDFIKRCKQAYASGERIYAIDGEGNPMIEKVVYLKDRTMVSNTFQSIKSLLHRSGLSSFEEELVLGSLRSFTAINSTDGQGLRTLDSFKKILKAMGGTWTKAIEDSFNKIAEGKADLASWMNLINAIKPFLYSYETKKVNNRTEKIPVQHKNSEYLLSALFTSLNSALNQSPELIALQEFMELHGYDAIQFESCVKEGCFNPLNLNYSKEAFSAEHPNESFEDWYEAQIKDLQDGKISQDEFNKSIAKYGFKHDKVEHKEVVKVIKNRQNYDQESYKQALRALQKKYPHNALVALELQKEDIGEDNAVHTIPMEDFMLAQPNSDHLTGAKALVGSQSRNITPADLPDDFEMTLTLGGTEIKLNREQTIKFYDTLFTDQILDNFEKLNIKFDNIKAVKAMLEAAMEGNPKYGEEIRKAFELNAAQDAFRMPMNSPTINNKAQDLLLSQFKNHIQRMHIEGGNTVLVSNFSLSDRLHVEYAYKTNKDGERVVDRVKYIPCYLPAFTREMYSDYLEEVRKGNTTYWTINYDKVKENNAEELFDIIGYRIPTEDKYSMMPIRIIGFLPIQAGASMMLPSDIITMSGTDFDIDKLFLMRKSFRREIAGPNLGMRFIDWVKKNRKDAATSIDESLLQKLVYMRRNKEGEAISLEEKKKGFTYEEIKSLYHKSDIFAEFIDNAEDIFYANPKYVVLKPKIIKDSSGAIDLDATSLMEYNKDFDSRQAIRNNMIIDMYWSILTSSEGSRQMMTPATYIHAKVSSRRERVMNDPVLLQAFINKYSSEIKDYGSIYNALSHFSAIVGKEDNADNTFKALENFIEQYATPDDPLDINFYISSHRNLMDGNDLIGGLAVNSSRHYKFQLCTEEVKENGESKKTTTVALRPEYRFNIAIPGYETHTIKEIDPRISPITGAPIGRICSELQAASPDNGKDPCLGDMGINMGTLPETNFMASVGFPAETIGFINRCMDLYAAGVAALRLDKNFKSKFKLKDYICDVGTLSDLAVKYRLGEDLRPTEEDELKSFALWYTNLLKCAKDLQKCSVFVRADSPNGALPVTTTEVVQHILKVQELQDLINNGDFSIDGLDSIIDLDMSSTDPEFNRGGFNIRNFRTKILDAKIPRLQAWYTCGIKSATSLVEKYLPEISQDVLDAVKTLEFLTGLRLSSKKNAPILRAFLNELTTYMLSANTSFSEGNIMENRNFYIHDFPMHFKKFLDERDSEGMYKHQDVRNLTLIKMLTNTSGSGIKFRNVGGKISPDSRQYFVEALDYLLQSTDPEVVDFGVDLFNYCYFENGLHFGHSNFGIFFSIDFIDSMPGFTARLHQANNEVLSGTFDLKDYIEQFLLNHPNLIPKVNKNFGSIDSSKGILTVSTEKDKSRLRRLNNATGQSSYRNLIKMVRPVLDEHGKEVRNEYGDEKWITEVYQFTELDGPRVIYSKVGFNALKGKSAIAFYDAKSKASGIEWEKLQNKGPVISSKLQEKIAERNAQKDVAAETPGETSMKVPTDTEPKFSGVIDEAKQAEKLNEAINRWVTSSTSRREAQLAYALSHPPKEDDNLELRVPQEKSLEEFPDTKEEKECLDITKVNFK